MRGTYEPRCGDCGRPSDFETCDDCAREMNDYFNPPTVDEPPTKHYEIPEEWRKGA